jgi:hypothetical protein
VRCVSFELAREPPARLSGVFDIALCLEVAEHVPAHLAPRLVAFLTSLSPVVVFSAATPGQGGQSHINEQPPSYWSRLFNSDGFAEDVEASHALRRAFGEAGVQGSWYVENTRVFRPAARHAALCG